MRMGILEEKSRVAVFSVALSWATTTSLHL